MLHTKATTLFDCSAMSAECCGATTSLQAYFDAAATVIQATWRGHYSRSHVHDCSARRAFLASAAAAACTARAGGRAYRDAMIKAASAEAASKAASAAAGSPTLAASSTARRRRLAAASTGAGLGQAAFSASAGVIDNTAAAALQKAGQQPPCRRALMAFTFPGGSGLQGAVRATHCASATATATATMAVASIAADLTGSCGTAAAAATAATTAAATAAAATATSRKGVHSHSHQRRQQPRSQQQQRRLATALLEAVESTFAARAASNTPDGCFDPVLTLQQAAPYWATAEADKLERRIDRGMVRLGILCTTEGQ